MKYKVGDKIRFVKDCELKDGRIIHAKSVWEVSDTSREYYLLRGVEENLLFTNIKYKLVDDCCEKINTAPSITKRINDKHNILNGLLNSDGSDDGEKLIEKLGGNQVQVANGVVLREKPQRPTESASTPASTGREEKFKVGDNVQFVRTMSFPRGGYIKRGTVWKIVAVNDTRYTLLLVDGEEGVKGIGYKINSSLDTVHSYCEKVEAKGNDSEEAKTKGSHYERAAMQPLEVMQRVMTAEQFEGFLYGCCIKYLLRKDYKGQRESDEYKARQYAYWLEMAKEGRTINPSKDKVPFDYKFSII